MTVAAASIHRVRGIAALVTIAFVAMTPSIAGAQVRRAPPAPPPRQTLQLRGFGDVGGTIFTASESFDTILGSHNGPVFGGGVEVVLPQRIFVNLHASRFQRDGSRVFVTGGQTFDLGIDTTVRVTPIEITGGYRLRPWRRNVIGYAGAGVGWHKYQETSDFADDSENVDETNIGYHVLGGAEYRVARLFGVAGELQWSTVPDALGQTPNGVAAAFDESNLGGVTFRVKLVVGR